MIVKTKIWERIVVWAEREITVETDKSLEEFKEDYANDNIIDNDDYEVLDIATEDYLWETVESLGFEPHDNAYFEIED